MSNKYSTLRALQQTAPVPALVCIDEGDFPLLWANYVAVHARIQSIFSAIHLTAAAFLDRHLQELEEVDALVWDEGALSLLKARLGASGLDADMAIAVRSSSHVEDAGGHSFAGMFATFLNVRGVADIKDAIVRVWWSNISKATVLERVRLGLLGSPITITVILQQMVDARWAGVAFSHDPVSGEEGVLIEATPGLGEALVSGADTGLQARLIGDTVDAAAGLHDHFAMLREVGALMPIAMRYLNGPADIEWAYDGNKVWLLQARLITALANDAAVHDEVFDVVELYAGADADIEAFKPLPDFAQYFRSKRKPLADFARAMDVPAGAALLIRANQRGLEDPRNIEQVLQCFTQPELVFDFSRHVRQQMLPRAELMTRLEALLRAHPSTFVIRDFVKGEAGLITHEIGTGANAHVLVELSPDGLLAINRGTATTTTIVIDKDGGLEPATTAPGPEHGLLTREHLRILHRTTLAAMAHFGQVQLEWVVSGGRLGLVDFSPISAATGNVPVGGGRIISAGYASGKSIRVEATRDLEELSIAASVSLTNIPAPNELGPVIQNIFAQIHASNGPVIIVSPRPYAALASLVPYAAGFIFEQASTLCHLAILLREHSVPALGSRELYEHALTHSHAIVDTSLV